MITNQVSSNSLIRIDSALPIDADMPILATAQAAPELSRAARAESTQKTGQLMIFAGFVITILAVIGYCAACFAGGMDADMGDILFENSVPFARGTLAIMGLGTLVWLVGSFTYLQGAMDSEGDAIDDGKSTKR